MTHNEKIVEAVARAIAEHFHKDADFGMDGASAYAARPREFQETARAAITAFQAEAWQDISTAPKDGEIIVITNGRWVEVTHWSASDDQFPWATLDPAIGINGRMEDSPTHWQPLPNPPASP